jgi:hypothetical protein
MKLLLTNDDGVDAPGLEALRLGCRRAGGPELTAGVELDLRNKKHVALLEKFLSTADLEFEAR